MLLFGAGGRFFLWNRMTDEVCEVMASRDLDENLSILKTGEFKGLGLTMCGLTE